ncbi:MAG TPA: ABC transporter ATP-binding protein [Treponemataceae bacterium]|nr:ABC transporter ATP-binding protein [Treponemataceae bacterium]
MNRNKAVRAAGKTIAQSPLECAVLLVAIAGVVLASLIPPWILGRAIDSNLATRSAEGLPLLAAAYVAAIALAGAFDLLKEAMLIVLGQRITKGIRSSMMMKSERLPASYFTKHETGSTVSRFTNDVDAIGSMFTGGIVGMLVDCLKILGIVASMFAFGFRLGLVAVALLPPIALLTRFFQSRMLAAQTDGRAQTAGLNAHITESLRNSKTIKAFNRERYMERRYQKKLDENYRTIDRINFYDAIFPCIVQVARALIVGAIVLLASGGVGILGITAGTVAAAIELASGLFAPIENIGMEFQGLQSAVAGARRVGEFLEEAEDDPKDAALTADRVLSGGAATIEFRDLRFAYGDGSPVLDGISLRVGAREKVSFTGRTGVGKTTLFRLVMGLLKPTSGSVTINGYDAHDIPNAEKKRIFGYVDQGLSLIDGTIADQIGLKDPDIGPDKIRKAIEDVGLADFVDGLERGMDTPIGSGTALSQGQRQLLAIARGIVADPRILLLDEMTANLDSVTERRVVEALERAGKSRTILAISHRPSSMIESDAVVILERGKVRDMGSPAVLAERDEWYRSFICAP